MKSESDKEESKVRRKSARRTRKRKGEEKVTREARSGKTCLGDASHSPKRETGDKSPT